MLLARSPCYNYLKVSEGPSWITELQMTLKIYIICNFKLFPMNVYYWQKKKKKKERQTQRSTEQNRGPKNRLMFKWSINILQESKNIQW